MKVLKIFSYFIVPAMAGILGANACFASDSSRLIAHNNKYFYKLKQTEMYVENAREKLRKSNTPGEEQDHAYRSLRGALQGLGTYRSYAGDYSGATSAFSEMFREDEAREGIKGGNFAGRDMKKIEAARTVDALRFIPKMAANRQIVILNEAHHVPAHRAFALGLARALRREGFEFLAIETLTEQNKGLLRDGYATVRTGVYTREPVFSKFVMDSVENGWRLVGYEPDGPPELRESEMAKNIISRILDSKPNARIFIYAGYTHAKEVPAAHSDDDASRLAAQIKRLTGIDPLTINQTTLFDQYLGKQQQKYYQRALKKDGSDKPFVMVDKSGRSIRLELDDQGYDITIVHPRYITDPVTGRPSWMRDYFIAFDIPDRFVPKKGARAVYAYLKDSTPDAIPLDVVLVRAGQRVPKLMVPKQYLGRIVVEFENEVNINVN